jgi:MarR family transcriptional regulator, 2-MHQ and catechol-resistance regulon repressor
MPVPPARPPLTRDAEPDLHLWIVLARAFRAIEAHAAADAARHGLTLAEFGILEALWHKGRLLLGELGQTILVSSGGITFLVDRLEKRGLVERQECEEDRRARYAVLTREGEKLVQRIFPEHAARLKQVLAGLDSDGQRAASELLKRLGRHAATIELAQTPGRPRARRGASKASTG